MDFLSEKAWDIVSGVFKGLWESIIGPFDDLSGLKTLVFNRYEDGEKVYGTFNSNVVTDAIAPGVQSMSFLVGFFLVLGIIFMGAKISNSGLNPSNRTVFIEFIRDWVIVVLLVSNVAFIYEAVFMFNSAIINFLSGELIENLDDKLKPELDDSGLVGWIILGLFMLGVTIWANFYYIMRQITLMVLMILGPVFLALFIFPQTKNVTLAWFREFFGTVMVQAVHAITLFTIATAAGAGGDNESALGLITMTIMYLVVIPTGEAVRGLLNLGGDTAGRLGKFGAMAGMAGISGIYGSVKSATSGKGFAESIKQGLNGSRGGGNNGKDGEGADASSSAIVGPAAGTDTKSNRMLRAGEIVSKGGKMALGSAGSIAGAVMGPQGAIVGGGLGTSAGGVGGGLAGRLGYAGGSKLKGALGKNGLIRGAAKDAESAANLEKEHEALAENMSQLKTDQWAKENKGAFMAAHANDPDKEQKWNKTVADQKQQFKKQIKDDLKSGKFDPSYAKASDLAENYAQQRLKEANENHTKADFMSRLPKTMSDEDKEALWDKEQATRLDKFRKQGNQMAQKLTGGKPLDSFIKKSDFEKEAIGDGMARFEQNEQKFRNDYMKRNPTATKEQADAAWNNARAEQRQALGARAKAISNSTKSQLPVINADDRKASDLVAVTADQLTKDWAKANEISTKQKLKEDAVRNIEKDVEKSWQTKVSQVGSQNREQAAVETANWAKENESQIKAGIAQQSPHLSKDEVNAAYGNVVSNKLQENIQRADNKTKEWATANQSSSMAAIKADKMQGIDARVNDGWKQAIQEKAAENYETIGNVAKQVSGGQSLGAFINKNDFSNAVSAQRIEQSKASLKIANPNMSEQELERVFAPHAKIIKQDTAAAVASISPTSISGGYSTRSAMASQFATEATDQWANNADNKKQFQTSFKQAFDSNAENKVLAQANPQAYSAKLNTAMGNSWNRAVGDKYNQNLQAAESSLMLDNATNGVVIPHTAGSVLAGAKAFGSSMVKNNSASIKAAAFIGAEGSLSERAQAATRAVYDHNMPDAPVEAKAKAYRDDVAYKAGVVRGVKGYQNKANAVMSNAKNPYAQQMYDNAYELSDIGRMARTEDVQLPNGQTQRRVAKDAIQLVVERDRSYLQVQTQDGQRQTVSQYGAGDSSLAEGTTLYKDYSFEDGALVASPNKTPNGNGFYAKDTSGGKIGVDRKLNMDANQLLQSRRVINNQEAEPRHDAYNYKVDQGGFDLSDVKSGSNDNKAILVVERDRSYVAMRGNDNKMYRVSPVQSVGNQNLKQGETVYKEYAVEGGKLRESSMNKDVVLSTYARNSEGQQIEVDSSRVPVGININDYVQQPKNKRFSRRQAHEQDRTKSGAYL